jgi:hypothetical protein
LKVDDLNRLYVLTGGVVVLLFSVAVDEVTEAVARPLSDEAVMDGVVELVGETAGTGWLLSSPCTVSMATEAAAAAALVTEFRI